MDLSKEAKDSMYDELLNYLTATYTEDPTDHPVTVDTLKMLTGMELNEDYVGVNNDDLTDSFKHIVVTYGFETFSDLYLYAQICTGDVVNKSNTSRNKDTDKLNRVTRTVIRNGKPMEMTVYEDPEAGSGKKNKPKQKPKDPEGEPELGIEGLLIRDVGETVTQSDLLKLNRLHKQMGGEKPFDANAQNYKVFYEAEEPVAMFGFSITEDFVEMKFFDSQEEIKDFDYRVIYEVVSIALAKEKGVILHHTGTKLFDYVMEDLEIKDSDFVGDACLIEQQTLADLFNFGDG